MFADENITVLGSIVEALPADVIEPVLVSDPVVVAEPVVGDSLAPSLLVVDPVLVD